MHYRSAVQSAFLVLTALCALAPPAAAVDQMVPGYAPMVIAGSTTDGGNTDYFRRVDLATGEFVGPALAFAAKKTTELNLDAEDTRPVRLVSRSLPPGDYAWVEADRVVLWRRVKFFSGTVCMDRHALVFSIQPDRINVIRADSLWIDADDSRKQAEWRHVPEASDSSVLAEVERVRATHPALVGAATVVQPKTIISWTKKSALLRPCGAEPDVFTLGPAPQ
ncbi:MAG TPA: hypothetical protein VGL66_09730 [Caulobacteraceae bacterium]|jgi:hypothetical protein